MGFSATTGFKSDGKISVQEGTGIGIDLEGVVGEQSQSQSVNTKIESSAPMRLCFPCILTCLSALKRYPPRGNKPSVSTWWWGETDSAIRASSAPLLLRSSTQTFEPAYRYDPPLQGPTWTSLELGDLASSDGRRKSLAPHRWCVHAGSRVERGMKDESGKKGGICDVKWF